MAELNERVGLGLEDVRRRIRASGGDPENVRIVAVTKGFGPEAVAAALEAGLTDIGENYSSEVSAKASSFEGAQLHFLGGVQRRQVSSIAPLVDYWHSVDRLEEGQAIATATPGGRVLAQVNIDGPGEQLNRSGVAPDDLPHLVEGLRGLDLAVVGLMAVGPPPPGDPESGFRRVSEMARVLDLKEISMGMSSDLEVAVRHGSTMVRVGRALFGDRPPKPPKGFGSK